MNFASRTSLRLSLKFAGQFSDLKATSSAGFLINPIGRLSSRSFSGFKSKSVRICEDWLRLEHKVSRKDTAEEGLNNRLFWMCCSLVN